MAEPENVVEDVNDDAVEDEDFGYELLYLFEHPHERRCALYPKDRPVPRFVGAIIGRVIHVENKRIHVRRNVLRKMNSLMHHIISLTQLTQLHTLPLKS